MTSENPQIQTLLQQINEVLNKTNPRLPWVMSSDAVQQRQVLEQTRDYLLALQQNGMSETAIAETSTVASQSPAAMEASAQQVLQAVVQEMNYLRSNMMQPLRSDVEMLRMQRDALTQEIRQLEAQRQQYGLPQQNPQYLTEFLQAAMTQMQQNFAAQVAQMLSTAPNSERLTEAQTAGLLEGSDAATLSPAERLERLQMMQSQSDQLMLRLDTTLRTVFESLQHNLQSYQDSLEEGLGRMHGMGQQGEAVFGAFVTRLGQILGREASSFLQSPSTRSDRPSLPGQRNVAERPDTPINRLLEELGALDQTAFNQAATGEPIPFDASSQRLSSETELANLEALDRALSQLDLSAIPDADELEAEELDDDLVLLQEDQDFFSPSNDQSSRSSFQTGEPDLVVLRSDQVRTDEELDSAIDLLSQITDETPLDNTPIDSRQEFTRPPQAAANPSGTSSKSSPRSSDPPLVENPDVLYNDEFYQTLFSEAEADQAEADEVEPASIDRPQGEASDVSPVVQSNEELRQADAPLDLDADLFAGLNEFADSDSLQSLDSLESPDSLPFSNNTSSGFTDLPQSLENQLLQPPQPFPPEETLDTFFDELEEPEASEEAEEEIETIAALTDLIPPPSNTPLYAEPPRLLDFGGDYEAAQLGEDLFGTESTSAEPTADFQLPSDSLQQLSADLFDLENRQSDATDQADQAGWVNWQESPSVEPPSVEPIYTGIEWSITDIPSVLLSQPYAGEMTAEDLLFMGEDEFVEQTSPETPLESSPTSAESDVLPDVLPNSQTEDPATEDPATELLDSTIEDWFSAVESDPIATPESARDDLRASPVRPNSPVEPSARSTSDPASFTVEDFADLTDSSSPASELPLATDESDSLNAFTLEGLDSLFEGLPSIDDPPGVAPPPESDTQSVTVDNVFDDWRASPSTEPFDAGSKSIESSSASPQTPLSPEGDRQKKKFGFRRSTDRGS